MFVRGLMPNLRYLCLFVKSGVQHILCCVFVLFFLYNVPHVVSFSKFPFLIAPLVFSNVYLSKPIGQIFNFHKMIERDIFQRIFLDFIVLGIFIDFFPYLIQTLPVQGPLWL
jgi:hypothetical protein